MKNQKWKYKITSGISGVIISLVMLVGFGGLAVWFHISQNNAIIIGGILVIIAALVFTVALYRAMFFKVLIDEKITYN